MLKLVRLALTAAVLTAIAVRLRRRARRPDHRPAPAGAPRSARRARRVSVASMWAGIAAIVAVVLAVALLPGRTLDAATATPSPQPPRTSRPAAPSPGATPQAIGRTPPSVPDPHCSPASRPVVVRPIDPKVRRAVDRQWRRIERWLRANAPRTYRTLNGPGRAGTIAVAEAQMGVDFPDDLRASLLRHNGSRGRHAFGLAYWAESSYNLGIREIRDVWRWQLCGRDGDWDAADIPFLLDTRQDFAAWDSYAVVDTAWRGIAWDEGALGIERRSSYYALLRAVAGALERGTPIDGRRPVVERGVLRWQDAP
ncbi:hypothetical protein MF672_043545 [Actinomadura sp. ATCC 31491]|uniref:Knr4/Smi1-like domain-containing protein n=1 Tax=Actinomadura luzonensis TaxID=2805427 RepID=A0ABT0G7R2_9ACTN|nr:SMI1/KNR4 family protein [Actinomadura luzonensis]MCK2220632.1 hypothetical protein [Actinomadura luzonensis]